MGRTWWRRCAARRLAVLAVEAGARGLVCSPHEVAAVRTEVGDDIMLITPGVRPAGAEANDQARVATPEDALRSGADLLVIGRPITGAADPGAAAAAIAASPRRGRRAPLASLSGAGARPCDVSQKGQKTLRDLRKCDYAECTVNIRSVILANLCAPKPRFSLPTRAELASFPSRSDFFDTKPEVTSRGSSSTYSRAAGSGT